MGISTHVLDVSLGKPAAGVAVTLEQLHDGQPTVLARAETDADGRVKALWAEVKSGAHYRLRFATGPWLARASRPSFFPEVCVDFMPEDAAAHYHVPLLLSPYGYSTYRGS